MRVVESAELLAADLFTHAEQTRVRLTFGNAQRHLAQLAGEAVSTTGARVARPLPPGNW